MSFPLEETPFFGLVGVGWLARVVDDVLGVSEEDEGGIVFCGLCFRCWVWSFAKNFCLSRMSHTLVHQ